MAALHQGCLHQREMSGQSVKLDLSTCSKPIPMHNSTYPTNYAAHTHSLRLTPNNVEGLPGLWVNSEADKGRGAPDLD
ncbi:MAG: hypothetical protein KIS62_15295 [Ramlibacter sp.]|nr:hypothetical protein [Ramlibacter sp.]